jgi:uncharacterized membrane protein
MTDTGRFKNHLRRKLLAGVLAAIPLAITGFIFWYVYSKFALVLGDDYAILGVPAVVAIIYLLGVFVTSLAGQYILGSTDWVLNRLPGLRNLYRTWKQVAVTPDVNEGVFSHVVLIPAELPSLRMLGFTSGRPIEGSVDVLCVFVPGTPNPVTGRLYFVSKSACRFLPVSAKEALKFIISGGNYVPSSVGTVLSESLSPP